MSEHVGQELKGEDGGEGGIEVLWKEKNDSQIFVITKKYYSQTVKYI